MKDVLMVARLSVVLVWWALPWPKPLWDISHPIWINAETLLIHLALN